MKQIYNDDNNLSKECVLAVMDIYNYLTLAKVNPYNIYGKCYDFDDNDLNETLSLSAGKYRGMSV
jgi:hypothetical protein